MCTRPIASIQERMAAVSQLCATPTSTFHVLDGKRVTAVRQASWNTLNPGIVSLPKFSADSLKQYLQVI